MYVDRFRSKILEKGLSNLFDLRREFSILDDNGVGSLSFQEFFSVIKKLRIEVADVDIKNAFKAFDLNKED